MKLLILPGDGIGPEITAAARGVLEALDAKFGLGLEMTEMTIGLAAHAAEGSTLPDAVLAEAEAADGVILGPCDTYAYPTVDEGGLNPSSTFRKRFDLYANIRPSRARPGVPCVAPRMDLVIARENTEGFYADRNMFSGVGEFMPTEDTALSVRKITRPGTRRIAIAAFELAKRRRKKVTAVHKANVLKVTDGLFLDEVRRVAVKYKSVELNDVLVDAMTAHLIRSAELFDVVVTTNMYGDILSDEAAELSGGLGLGGSVNVGDEHGFAQAAHGSAPDIAGKGVANPTAMIVSAAMLLDWLGARRDRKDLIRAADAVQKAVDAVLADRSLHTPDLGGTGTTAGMAQAVAAAVAGK